MNAAGQKDWTRRVAWLVTTWTGLYTVGLSTVDRAERIAEIESDLWEMRSEIGGADIVSRLLRGMPSDLLWRIQMIGNGRKPEMELDLFWTPKARAAGLLGAAAVALMIVLQVVDNIAYYGGPELIPADGAKIVWMALVAIGIAATVIGFVVMRRSPGTGAALAVSGSLTAGLAVYWIIIPPLVAIGLSIVAIRRARSIVTESSKT